MTAILLVPLYAAVIIYLMVWGMRLMKACSCHLQKTSVKRVAAGLWILLSLTPALAFLFPMSHFKRIVVSISNYWLGGLLYLTLLAAVMDLLRLILKKWIRIPFLCTHGKRCLLIAGSIVLLGSCTAVIWGSYTARNLAVTNYSITVEKELPKAETLRIALIADLHMGYSIGSRQIEALAEKLNAIQPDLVCIAGDIFDNSFKALDDPEKIIAAFQSIESRYGIYACFGNHDYEEAILAGFTFDSEHEIMIGSGMRQLLEQSGVRTLEDEVLLIDDSFYLAGRKDYSSRKKTGAERKSADELLQGINKEKTVIVLDHQPRESEELAAAGADLDLCGHTHDGQMFPGNLVTDRMWKNSYGLLNEGSMKQIVTSGAGIFGPYMRIGTKSEIAVIDITFKGAVNRH